MGITNPIGQIIKYLRHKQEMTQTELARKINVTRSTVNAWELNISSPNIDSLITLAEVFHTTTDFLLGIAPEETISLRKMSPKAKRLLYIMADTLKQNDAYGTLYHDDSLGENDNISDELVAESLGEYKY